MSEHGGRVLLIAADWRVRTLVLAELKEAGYEVVALPGVRWALSALSAGRVQPELAVVDVTRDPDACLEPVRHLLRLLGDVPVVLLLGAYDARDLAPLRDRVAAWLPRPLRVARVVEAVRHLLLPTQTPNSEP